MFVDRGMVLHTTISIYSVITTYSSIIPTSGNGSKWKVKHVSPNQ
jgi:hypothetical protein